MYITMGIFSILHAIFPIGIGYALLMLFFVKLGIRQKPKRSICFCEYVYLLYIWVVLDITGIIGMQFNLQWFVNSFRSLGLYLPTGKGDLMMLTLNLALFIPLGLLTPYIFSKHINTLKRVALSLMLFSVCIEVVQMFGGRSFELNDIIMNTLGSVLGYVFYKVIKKLTYISIFDSCKRTKRDCCKMTKK